jgi:hypothetical protein
MEDRVAEDFGCEYCADDQNRWHGYVTQIGSSWERGMILLRCPRCRALYENSAGDQTGPAASPLPRHRSSIQGGRLVLSVASWDTSKRAHSRPDA